MSHQGLDQSLHNILSFHPILMTHRISVNTKSTTVMFSEVKFSPTLPVSNDVGVGLSNPQFSQGRRRMLDLVNRLHSTGSVFFFLFTFFFVFSCSSTGAVFRSTLTFLKLLSSVNRVLGSRLSSKQSPALLCLGLLELVLGQGSPIYPKRKINKWNINIVVQPNAVSRVHSRLGNVSLRSDSLPIQKHSR